MRLIRRFRQNGSLRSVNLLGLALVFACLSFSYSHIRKELSYDRFHENAGRIVRLSVQYDNEPIDGRIYSPRIPDPEQLPEVEQLVNLSKVNSGIFIYEGKPHSITQLPISSTFSVSH